jgi:hypothetical protein
VFQDNYDHDIAYQIQQSLDTPLIEGNPEDVFEKLVENPETLRKAREAFDGGAVPNL